MATVWSDVNTFSSLSPWWLAPNFSFLYFFNMSTRKEEFELVTSISLDMVSTIPGQTTIKQWFDILNCPFCHPTLSIESLYIYIKKIPTHTTD
jgi:hypothetical protein